MQGEIHKLMPKVAEDIGHVGKTGKNRAQNYSFRGIEAVMNAVHGSLCKHGVTVLPRLLDQVFEIRPFGKYDTKTTFCRLTIQYDFFAPDGSMISAVVVGEGMDQADKAANKAMSAAYKYAIGQAFSIPFDAIDSEDDKQCEKPKASKASSKSSSAPKPTEQKKPVSKTETKQTTSSTPAPTPAPTTTEPDATESAKYLADTIKRARNAAINAGIKTAEECFSCVSAYLAKDVTDWTQCTVFELETAINGFAELARSQNG